MINGDLPITGPEALGLSESLFPFHPIDVVDGLSNLATSSNNMLKLITEVRGRYGVANSLYANMPVDDLINWHIGSGDFQDNGALLYKAGLLYGMDLAQHVHRIADVDSDFTYDNSDYFDKALNYLHESYRGLEDESDEVDWIRQKHRELHYTGSDILSLANATVYDKTRSRLYELGVDHVAENALAQHVGIVDGAIFIDAYRAFSRGKQPVQFDNPKELTPTYNPDVHVKGELIDLVARFEFERIDELLGTVSELDELGKQEINTNASDGLIYTGYRRLVQFGPNAFTYAVEIETVEAPKYNMRRIGCFALIGAAVDASYVAVTDLPVKYIPIATLMNVGIALYIDKRNRHMISKDAENRGINFVVNS